MDIKRMTAKELANMTLEQFNSLTLKESTQVLAKLNKAVNQSVKRAEAAGEIATKAPAYKTLMEGGGRIKTSGYKGSSGLNMAKAEIKRASDYLNMKTRTVTGAKAHHKQAAKYFGLDSGATPEEVTKVSKQVDKILEEFPAEFAKTIGQSYQTITKEVSSRLQAGNSPEQIRNALETQYQRIKAGEIDTTQNYEQQVWTEFNKQLDGDL